MSFLDRLVAAVTPPESEETRMQARADARAHATPGSWLEAVLDHHEQIEAAFEATRAASSAAERTRAMRELGLLLTGHSNAEEAVLYPALANGGHKTHAAMAYEEQAMAKIQMGALEQLDPMSNDFLEKLEHIRGAVTHHMYEEESDWFLELHRELPDAQQAMLGQRYREEVDRYAAAELA